MQDEKDFDWTNLEINNKSITFLRIFHRTATGSIKKTLYMISTHPFINQQLSLNISRRFKSTNELASRHFLVKGRANVSVPYISAAYTYNMGGVDRFDRIMASWDKIVKSKKWWFRIFLFFLHAIKINAYLLNKQILKKNQITCTMTVEDFIEKLL